MKNILDFNGFLINESSAAGNRWETYPVPFKYSSSDARDGYTSKSFADDLRSALVERPELEDEIIEFISDKMGISSIEDLEKKPFSYLEVIIPEIERIISAGEYEPEVTMPGGGLLFIRNKKMKDGREADFYINRKGTKIEAVSDRLNGDEESEIYYSKDFPFEKYEFTEEEIEETKNIIKAKGI